MKFVIFLMVTTFFNKNIQIVTLMVRIMKNIENLMKFYKNIAQSKIGHF
jgi:hypothetical protein